MENKGLLFIPDISGFTRFINETDIEHSRLIIQELLEILINANQIGLEISEIEGDAILFYKFGECPHIDDVYKQVEKMFCEFHRNLIAYDNRRFCQCKACTSAVNLTLKVVTHYGEFTSYSVKSFNKLIGKDIIVAHQLLKNNIEQHEYWLVTNSMLNNRDPADFEHWMKWNSSAKQTESGEISFHYTQLSQLKRNILPEPSRDIDLSKKTKVLSVSREFDTDIITLFHATGDVNYRPQWQEGIRSVEEVNHFLPRVGMEYRFISENHVAVMYASSYSYHPERIEFSETDESNQNSSHYILEKQDDNKTKLVVDFYLQKNKARELIFKLMRKNKDEEKHKRSLLKLADLVKTIKLPSGTG